MISRTIVLSALMVFVSSVSVNADIVTFTDFSVGGFEDIKNGGSTSGSKVQDGVTFTLTLFSAGPDNPSVVNFSPDMQEITGVYKASEFGTADRDGRLDSDSIGDTFDDEAIRFTIAVSGASLDSLYFNGLDTNLFTRNGENMDASDGTNTVNVLADLGADRSLNYDDDFIGLTRLSLANVDTWQLTVTAREVANGSEKSSFSFPSLSFGYTLTAVPEPSSLAVLSAIGLACLAKRRRRSK